MNQDRFKRFSEVYRDSLKAAVSDPRQTSYGYLPAECDAVADRMLKTIMELPYTVSYCGGGFRRTCAALGIRNTRKAILAFLEHG